MEVEIAAEDFFEFALRKAKHLCAVKGCRKQRRKHGGGRLCSGCIMSIYRARYPKKSAYFTLRDHATRKGVDFSLSFERFCEVIEGTPYIETHGNKAGGYHIDRIDAEVGYTDDNVQVLTISENAIKANEERWGCHSWSHRKSIERRESKQSEPETFDDSQHSYEQQEGDPF